MNKLYVIQDIESKTYVFRNKKIISFTSYVFEAKYYNNEIDALLEIQKLLKTNPELILTTITIYKNVTC